MLKYILIFLFIFSFIQSKGAHIMGGEIEYISIGIRTWKIRFTTYSECNNTSPCTSMSNCKKGVIVAPSTVPGLNPVSCMSLPSFNLMLDLVKVEDTDKKNNKRCGSISKNKCTNMGQVPAGIYNPGFERYIFEGVLDMSSSIYDYVCPYWDITLGECCRGSSYNFAGQPNFSNKATLNIYAHDGKNSSPLFLQDPVMVYCEKQESTISLGALDSNSDSLSFAFISSMPAFPLYAMGPPHSGQQTPAMIFDPLTGDLTFNALSNGTIPIGGSLIITITQWNDSLDETGNKIRYITGITEHDVIALVTPCPGNNSSPALTTGPGNQMKQHWEVTEGTKICFTVTANDPDPDSTFIYWNNGISRPGKITFEPDYDTALARPQEDRWKFCWQTETGDLRTLPYYFTIGASDNKCPVSASVNKTFSIKVVPEPKVSIQKIYQNCSKWSVNMLKLNAEQHFVSAWIMVGLKPNDFSFSQGYTSVSGLFLNPQSPSPATIVENRVSLEQPGKYLIKYMVEDDYLQHFYYDTIWVLTYDSTIHLNLPDTFKCRAAGLTLNPNPTGGAKPYLYSWYRNTVAGQALNYPNYTVPSYSAFDTATVKYILKVSDIKQCFMFDTFELKVNALSHDDIKLLSLPKQCMNENRFDLTLGKLMGFSNHQHKWTSGQLTSTDTSISVHFSTTGLHEVLLTVTENGCKDSLKKVVEVKPSPKTNNTIDVDDSLQCIIGNRFVFSPNLPQGYQHLWIIGADTSFKVSPQFSFNTVGLNKVALKITNNDGCSDTAFKFVRVTPIPVLPTITNLERDTQCLIANKFRFTFNPADGYTYEWVDGSNNSDSISIIRTFDVAGSASVNLVVTESGGCTDTAYKNVFVVGKPAINTLIHVNNAQQCEGNNAFEFTYGLVNNINLYQHTWLYHGASYNDDTLNLSQLTAGTKTIKLIVAYDSLCIDTAQTSITIHGKPETNEVTTVNDMEQCLSGNKFEFTYHQPMNENNSKQWLIEKSVYDGNNAIHTFSTSGLKPVRLFLKSNLGCSDTVDLNVLVKEHPLHYNISGVINAYKDSMYEYGIPFNTHEYKWESMNGIIDGTMSSNIVKIKWPAYGKAKVMVLQEEEGCFTKDSLEVDVVKYVRLNGKPGISDLAIIPNPNNGKFSIHLYSDSDQFVTIKLFSSLGTLITQKDYSIERGENFVAISVDVAGGMYYAELSNNNSYFVSKVVLK